jgi:hypothetical protein
VKPFPLNSRMRKKHPVSTLLFDIILEFLGRPIKQEEEIKEYK